MKSRLSYLTLFGFVCIGCCTTANLNSAVDANRKVRNDNGTILARTGREIDFRNLIVRVDSSFYREADDSSSVAIATKDIRSVHVSHHFAGALEGILFGSLGGGIGFGVLGTLQGGGGGDGNLGRALAVAAGAFVGGGVGLVIGAIKGHTYTFKFPNDTTTTSTHAPPDPKSN